MAVDFKKSACREKTNANLFGICDDPPPTKNPAYLDYSDSDNWIAWVDNQLTKSITFTAIDHCIEIDSSRGERCDGLLEFDTTIIFVELKDRDGGRWLGKARDQLKNTIDIYNIEVGLGGYTRLYAYMQ